MEPSSGASQKKDFSLPPQVVGQKDINRLLRELEILEAEVIGMQARGVVPKVTDLLIQTAQANSYDLAKKDGRENINNELVHIRDKAPVLHMSFATEPAPKFIEALLAWLRSNVHRYALLQIGLQPSIAAGCVLRTPNKIFDMSLGASFEKQKPFLVSLIKGAALDPELKGGAKQ